MVDLKKYIYIDPIINLKKDYTRVVRTYIVNVSYLLKKMLLILYKSCTKVINILYLISGLMLRNNTLSEIHPKK
jgi:hypothetical protein